MKSAVESMDIDLRCINTIRFLAVDMIEKANSGHPGLPLGAAPMAYALFDKIMRYNPRNPKWFNRDRFILSAGHGCALQYALLYLTGYDLAFEELLKFRRWGSLTPGHPEFGETPGVEATTGPLGQGFAMGVGMAMAERYLAAYFNRPNFPIIDHYNYAIVSDGDLMEGVASEAASLAGHLKLSKLIYLYDDNHISIDGKTEMTFTEDVGKRFEAFGWFVSRVSDGTNVKAIESAIRDAQGQRERASLIMVRTHIGYGSPKQDSSAAHGEPLGAEATRKTKENLGWPLEPAFFIPDEALKHFREALPRGEKNELEWNKLYQKYRESFPELAEEFNKMMAHELPGDWDTALPVFEPGGAIATRDACGKVMNAIADKCSFFLGGSADLAASTKTDIKGKGDFSFENPSGRNIRFGIREHAMGSISNGIYQHGGLIPFTGTFLVFSDYMRPAIRLAAIMRAHVIFIFSHDSIALGEDGPTHQPESHLLSLRAIPNLVVLRPADANETSAAWKLAMLRKGPAAIITTRQKLPVLDTHKYPVSAGFARGAYILEEFRGEKPDIILVASGSEVQLVLAAGESLSRKGMRVRIISMPSWEIFDEQPTDYRTSIFLPGTPKLAVEAGCPLGWHKYIGENGDIIGVDRFGASAPGNIVMDNYGFTVENIINRALRLIDNIKNRSARTGD